MPVQMKNGINNINWLLLSLILNGFTWLCIKQLFLWFFFLLFYLVRYSVLFWTFLNGALWMNIPNVVVFNYLGSLTNKWEMSVSIQCHWLTAELMLLLSLYECDNKDKYVGPLHTTHFFEQVFGFLQFRIIFHCLPWL